MTREVVSSLCVQFVVQEKRKEKERQNPLSKKKKPSYLYMQDIQTFSIKHSPTHMTPRDPEKNNTTKYS